MEDNFYGLRNSQLGRKPKTLNPEVALARSYTAHETHREVVELLSKDSMIMPKTNIAKTMSTIDGTWKTTKDEIIKRFILPNLENKSKMNINESLKVWSESWKAFLDNMPREEYKKFLTLESSYRTKGVCYDYENIELPKKYRRAMTDLTDAEWEKKLEQVKMAKKRSSNIENKTVLRKPENLIK